MLLSIAMIRYEIITPIQICMCPMLTIEKEFISNLLMPLKWVEEKGLNVVALHLVLRRSCASVASSQCLAWLILPFSIPQLMPYLVADQDTAMETIRQVCRSYKIEVDNILKTTLQDLQLKVEKELVADRCGRLSQLLNL